MTDLSVIIPIYNTPVEDLERCFRSVCALKEISFEALLIDDGSAPEVGAFCRDYAENTPGFTYRYKENGGVSSARNLGMTMATGRYITFLDADDILLPDTLVKHMPQGEDMDLVLFDILLTQRGSDSVWRAFDLPRGQLTREQALYRLCTAARISGPVAKLYKRSLLQQHGLTFDTRFIAGEDWMFVCEYLMKAERISYCDECSYQYFREESTGQSRMARFPDKMLHNQLARYERKQQLIASETWTQYAKEQILSLAAVELIENLFNSAADLLLIGQYTKPRKLQIREAVSQAGKLLTGAVPKKTRIKLCVLEHCPPTLWLLASLRAGYLKMKK